MNGNGTSELVHPTSEDPAEVKLPTLGGQVTVVRTDEALTPYGGLAAWSAFVNHLGTLDRLAENYPQTRTSHNAAPVREIIHSFSLTALVEGKRFSHVGWLIDDPGIAAVMGMKRVRAEDAFPRLIKVLEPDQARQWLGTAEQELYAGVPERFIADWDSTINPRYGHQEGAAKGDNPFKRGRPSHHPLICVVAGTRLCLHLEWRPGDTVSASGWQQAMERLWSQRTIQERLWLNRGDAGFGQEPILAWHEAEGQSRPKYLFKLRLTKNVRRAIAQVPWPLWEGQPTLGCEQVAETTVQLQGWSRARRVIVVRTLKPLNPSPQAEFWRTPEDEVRVYVTNLTLAEATPEQVVLLYRKRADAENVFDELKNQWGFRGFCSQRGVVTETAARLLVLTYNLWTLFVRLMGAEPGQHVEAVRSRRQFLVLAAQLVRTGRQKVWKLAVSPAWWATLNACYQRLFRWLTRTAPQLEKQRNFLRLLTYETPLDPSAWFAQTIHPSSA